MAEGRTGLPIWKRLAGEPMVLVGATVAVVLVLVALPIYKDRRQLVNPAADAQASYNSLLAQIRSAQTRPAAGPTPRQDDSSGVIQRLPLSRDLFAPMPLEFAHPGPLQGETQAGVRPSVLRLSGIFLDGPLSQAVIGGQLVAKGDYVDGYCLIEVQRDWVLLWKDGAVERLRLGGKQ